MLNEVKLIGHIGQNPEIRNNGESKVANFTLATNEKWKNKNGKDQESTEWHKIVCWNRLAEIVEKYLHQGSFILVEGKLKTDKWQDKDGNDRYATKVILNKILMLDKKNNEQPEPQREYSGTIGNEPDPIPGPDDDNLPF